MPTRGYFNFSRLIQSPNWKFQRLVKKKREGCFKFKSILLSFMFMFYLNVVSFFETRIKRWFNFFMLLIFLTVFS